MMPTGASEPTLPRRPAVYLLPCLIVGQLLVEQLGSSAPLRWLAVVAVCLLGALAVGNRRWLFALLSLAMVAFGASRQSQVIRSEQAAFAVLQQLPRDAASLSVIQGTLASSPRRSASTWSLYLRSGSDLGVAGEHYDLPEMVAISIPVDRSADLDLSLAVPGDQVLAVGGLFELPADRTSTDPLQWHRERGAVALLRARRVQLIRDDSWVAGAMRLSQQAGLMIERQLTGALPRHEASLLLGMMTGKMHLMSDRQNDAFRRTGLVHLFSVSGLHTMLVGGMMVLLLRFLGLGLRTRLVVLALLLAFFASLVGVRTAVIRACCLLMLMESRGLLGRNVDPLAALASIAMLILMIWPRALWQLDFQLTFLCMLALLIMGPWNLEIRMAVGKRLGWGKPASVVTKGLEILATSAAIQLLLAPILLARFGEVSVVAPLANMVLLPVAIGCVYLGFLACLLGLTFPALSSTMMALVRWGLEVLNMGSTSLATPPMAVISGASPGLVLSLLYAGVLVMGPWSQQRSVTQPRRSAWQFVPGVLAVVLVLSLWRLPPPVSHYEVHFIDVGQGDATLIRARGQDWLVDGGPPEAGRPLVGTLRRLGVTRLAGVVATHADADHIGGLPEVLAQFPIGAFYVNGEGAPTDLFSRLELAAERHRIAVNRVERGASLSLDDDGAVARVLHPSPDFLADGPDRNDASLVLMVELAQTRILLTGDAEAEAETAMLAAGVDLKADVLKAGHHGAATSSSEAFLAAVAPEAMIFSAGRGNRFGHPSPAALTRAAEAGAAIFRTDQQGSIHLRIGEISPRLWTVERGILDTAATSP